MSEALGRIEGMDALLAHLEEVIAQTRGQVGESLGDGQVLGASDDEIVRALTLAAELGRLADAVLIEGVGEVSRRSVSGDRSLRMTSRYGCHDVSELVQRATRVSPATAARLAKAAKATMVGVSFAGTPMEPRLPGMRDALMDGVVGIDGLLAVAGPLGDMDRRVGRESVLIADSVLAAEARGTGPEATPSACADALRVQALAWATYLDQDGAAPREDRAAHLRGLRLGAPRDGLVPVGGGLLPEVAAQLVRICDAVSSPRVDGHGGVQFRPSDASPTESGDAPADPRTRAQKMHDALATALFTAASSELLPTIGGAAPTLIVSVREEDLIEGRGWAHVEGVDEPVSLGVAHHTACAGITQRVVLSPEGRIVRLGNEERVFNRHQRRAIALRDGGCLIPGCGVPAGWCEIHHVDDHAKGGPTHTDNGVLLCWFHHRHLNNSGWQIRITRGVPEVMAPPWIEVSPVWRPATTSKQRLKDAIVRRM